MPNDGAKQKQTITDNLPPISKLINFVEYQDDAIVSKTLLDTKAETVTISLLLPDRG